MRLSPGQSFFRKVYTYLRHPYPFLIKPDYAITSSEFTAAATKHHYNISDDRVIAVGTPKTDFLLSANNDNHLPLQDPTYAEFFSAKRKRILF